MNIFNTGETAEELNNKYNPDGSVLREAQLRMLDMLLYLDNICKQQGLSYSLDSGNVLGAVRHGGFIPWDDDVDIIMELNDYRKLCRYLLKHPHNQYVLQTPMNDPFYINHWCVLRDLKSEYIQDSHIHNMRKFKGLQVDIFPIENKTIAPLHYLIAKSNYLNQKFVLKHCKYLSKLLFYINSIIIIPCIRTLSRLFGNKDIYAYAYGLPWPQFRYQKSDLFPLSSVSFENYPFPSPNNVDSFLRKLYGSYWELPNNRDHHKASYKIWK